MIHGATSVAAWGILANLQQMEAAAAAISNPDQPAGIPEIVSLKQAEQGMRANIAVLQLINETSDHLIDIIA